MFGIHLVNRLSRYINHLLTVPYLLRTLSITLSKRNSKFFLFSCCSTLDLLCCCSCAIFGEFVNSCSCGSVVVDAHLQLRPFLLSLLCVLRLHLPSFSAFPLSFIAGPYARFHSSRSRSPESVVVIRNVYGTFNFIWIITICFRRLAEKFSTCACCFFPHLSFISLFLASHAPFAAPLPGQWAMKWALGVPLSGVPGLSYFFPVPSPARNVIANFRQMWILNLQVQLFP